MCYGYYSGHFEMLLGTLGNLGVMVFNKTENLFDLQKVK